MNLECRQTKKLVEQIKKNTQYLSNIIHIRESKDYGKQVAYEGQVCSVSTARLITQLGYLIHTCQHLKTNFYICMHPFYIKKKLYMYYIPFLEFFIEQEKEQCFKYLQEQAQNKFQLINYVQYRTNLLNNICQLITNVFPHTVESAGQQYNARLQIKNLFSTIQKKIEPIVLSQCQMPVIKYLERTSLFAKYSDLLMAFNNSLYYNLKKNPQVIQLLKQKKYKLLSKMQYLSNGVNVNYAYQLIDIFFQQLIDFKIIYTRKSSSRDYKDTQNLTVGYIQESKSTHQKPIRKYCIRFYHLNKNCVSPQLTDQLKKQGSLDDRLSKKYDVNDLMLEYICEKGQIILRFITNLDANPETIDIISIHAASILSKQNTFSIETIQSVRSTSDGTFSRKFIVFNCYCLLAPNEDPLTKILSLIQVCTISARIYIQVIYKLPNQQKQYHLQQCTNRLQHLNKLVIEKAQSFYQKL